MNEDTIEKLKVIFAILCIVSFLFIGLVLGSLGTYHFLQGKISGNTNVEIEYLRGGFDSCVQIGINGLGEPPEKVLSSCLKMAKFMEDNHWYKQPSDGWTYPITIGEK